MQYELQTTERFIRKHIGDYSGYYHRQFVLYKMNELNYFEHEPNHEGNLTQYAALINYLASIGSTDAEIVRNRMPTPRESLTNAQPVQNYDCNMLAWKSLMKIITPERDFDSVDDLIRIKSFLYCMNVAAYDLKFISELKEMFGYREALECHRRAIIQFLADKCTEWSVTPLLANDAMKLLEKITNLPK